MDEQDKTNDEIDGEDEEHEPPRRKRRSATTESIALLASDEHVGIVLACDGEGIEYEVREMGPHLGDFGLDDAPVGIVIWEGRVVYSDSNIGFDHDGADVDMKGSFRRPTPEEWTRIAAGLTPWEFEDETPAAPTKTEPSANEIAEAIDLSRRAMFLPGNAPDEDVDEGVAAAYGLVFAAKRPIRLRSLQKRGVSSRHVAEALRIGVLVFAGTSDDED